MCKRYKLQAKRPHEKEFTEWCETDNYETVEKNIKVIESYGWQWELKEGKENTSHKKKFDRSEYMKRYYKENREYIRAYARNWYIENHDEVRAKQKEYKQKRKGGAE